MACKLFTITPVELVVENNIPHIDCTGLFNTFRRRFESAVEPIVLAGLTPVVMTVGAVCWLLVCSAQQEATTEELEQLVTDLPAALPTQSVDKLPPVANQRKEPRKSEQKETNNKPPPTSGDGDNVIYRLNSEGGNTCILLRVDAIVSFKYTTKLNQRQESDIFIPNSATVDGDCTGDDQQTLILKWKSFVLIWSFRKTPGGERWYVDKIELKYDTTDHIFEHIKDKGRSYTLTKSSSHNQLLLPTPVGYSYWCDREIDIQLTNTKQTDTTATLLLRDLTIEPFIFKNDEFGVGYKCSAIGAGSFRSETAPFIVGSTLAAVCLFTVAGYGIYRYIKIKKVQYDTME
ncbi:hypothetical protein AAG570_001416 [Ranatra chinensis]|uniref:Lysosome-associated membrane glycoprotein 2-like luminal domain-containing protein n=1 Tax=Ranatra chinensis TaxID=642074 RepID=A0ABD0YBU3_9HEMI